MGQNTHALERRSSDPGSFSVINSPFEDERGILAIQSSVLSSHSGVKKKSFSAGKERKDRGSSSSTAKGKDSIKNIEKRKKNKTGKHLSLRFNFRVSSCLPPPLIISLFYNPHSSIYYHGFPSFLLFLFK